MAWITLNNSKKAVRRAGDFLISDHSDLVQYAEAYSVLDNWRASHAYPIHSMLGYFKRKAYEVDSSALIARRLKRTPSILDKLYRENGMKLDRMEDIGGVRIVVNDLNSVFRVAEKIKGGRTRNLLKRERDYIEKPKISGYRGIHLIYQYKGSKIGFPSHNIELQIRSKMQHAWATTVEVVGTFTKQGLKAGVGKAEWLDFFKLAGDVFSDYERSRGGYQEAIEREDLFIKQVHQLGVLTKLQQYAVSTQYINENPDRNVKYYILILNTKKGNISVGRFSDFQIASAEYGILDKRFEKSNTEDVVLVSTESLKSLSLAYPNYFADTTAFRQRIRKIIANKTQQANL